MTSPSRARGALEQAAALVATAGDRPASRPQVTGVFDAATGSVSYLVADADSDACAVIDSVLDFDAASGRTGTTALERIASLIAERSLRLEWILETHVHADHLSAAPGLQGRFGGRTAIGREVRRVQATFGPLFNICADVATNGRAFDRLFADGDGFRIGGLEALVLHVPGHTPACVAYVIGDAVFVGDTLFMPDYGSARCDFPGGDAAQLHRSARRLLGLPPETRMFVGHDYKAPGRETYAWETTVALQRAGNIHLNDTVDEAAFVRLRTERDRTLPVPRLFLPSVQVNLQAGRLPPPEGNGIRYLKIPMDAI